MGAAPPPRQPSRPPSRDEILAAARFAGLDLPPAYQDELVVAYGYVRAMCDRLPHSRPRGDEPAHVFDPARFLPGEA